MKKPYELPTISTIGSIQSLTQVNKCGGSGDVSYPQILDPFSTAGCAPSSGG
jgi:hypothetical protein